MEVIYYGKTVKYFIGIATYNTPFTTMTITQKQYNEMFKKYTEIIKENHATNTPDNTENYVEQKIRTYEHDKYTEEMIDIDDGSTYIALGKIICKEGYKFK